MYVSQDYNTALMSALRAEINGVNRAVDQYLNEVQVVLDSPEGMAVSHLALGALAIATTLPLTASAVIAASPTLALSVSLLGWAGGSAELGIGFAQLGLVLGGHGKSVLQSEPAVEKALTLSDPTAKATMLFQLISGRGFDDAYNFAKFANAAWDAGALTNSIRTENEVNINDLVKGIKALSTLSAPIHSEVKKTSAENNDRSILPPSSSREQYVPSEQMERIDKFFTAMEERSQFDRGVEEKRRRDLADQYNRDTEALIKNRQTQQDLSRLANEAAVIARQKALKDQADKDLEEYAKKMQKQAEEAQVQFQTAVAMHNDYRRGMLSVSGGGGSYNSSSKDSDLTLANP
ncbi:hypothetical protein AB7M31_002262 [Pseudomonas sp. IAP-CY TE4608]